MASQPTGISAPAFAAPSLGRIKPTILRKNACQEHTTDNVAAPASYVEVGGAELMAAPVMGGGAPADNDGKMRRLSAEAGSAIQGGRFMNKTKSSRGLFAKAAVASA